MARYRLAFFQIFYDGNISEKLFCIEVTTSNFILGVAINSNK